MTRGRTNGARQVAPLLVALATVSMLVAFPAAGQQDNQATFYENDNYGGARFTPKYPDMYADLTRSSPSWNDKISSLRMGKNTRALVYENTYYGGSCIAFFGKNVGGATGAYPNLSGFGWNDRISSVILRDGATGSTCVTPGANEAVFWQNSNYGGAQFRLLIGQHLPNLTSIPFPGGGNWNDSISSLKLGATVRVLGYADTNFRGKCYTFFGSSVGGSTGEYANLAGMTASLPSGQTWNDRISSIRVVGANEICH